MDRQVARQGAVSWAQKIVDDPGVLYLDTETTGLSYRDEIVDIAIVNNQGETVFNSLVQPHQQIPQDASRVHGITDDMVRDAPTWGEIFSEIDLLIASSTHVVIYNREYDVRLLRQTCEINKVLYITASWSCAMLQYAAYVGQVHPKYGGWRWHKLTDAAQMIGYIPKEAHRAQADALMCREIVFGIASEVELEKVLSTSMDDDDVAEVYVQSIQYRFDKAKRELDRGFDRAEEELNRRVPEGDSAALKRKYERTRIYYQMGQALYDRYMPRPEELRILELWESGQKEEARRAIEETETKLATYRELEEANENARYEARNVYQSLTGELTGDQYLDDYVGLVPNMEYPEHRAAHLKKEAAFDAVLEFERANPKLFHTRTAPREMSDLKRDLQYLEMLEAL